MLSASYQLVESQLTVSVVLPGISMTSLFKPWILKGHIAKMIGMPRHSRHVGQGTFFLLDRQDSRQRTRL